MSNQSWYVTIDGATTIGPVTTEEVRAGLAAGTIPLTAQVNLSGTAAWQDVGAIPAFSRAGVPPPAPLPTRGATATAAGAVKSRAPFAVVGALSLVAALLAFVYFVALREPLPTWAMPLAASRSGLEGNDHEGRPFKLEVTFAEPTTQLMLNRAGRDWKTWVRYEVTVGWMYDVERRPLLDVSLLDGGDLERACVFEGNESVPASGAKAKLILLVPNIPDAKELRVSLGTFGKARLVRQGENWRDAREVDAETLAAKRAAAASADAAKKSTMMVELRKFILCCDALKASARSGPAAQQGGFEMSEMECRNLSADIDRYKVSPTNAWTKLDEEMAKRLRDAPRPKECLPPR